jgi:hypothetical protein
MSGVRERRDAGPRALRRARALRRVLVAAAVLLHATVLHAAPLVYESPLPPIVRICVQAYAPFVLQRVRQATRGSTRLLVSCAGCHRIAATRSPHLCRRAWTLPAGLVRSQPAADQPAERL